MQEEEEQQHLITKEMWAAHYHSIYSPNIWQFEQGETFFRHLFWRFGRSELFNDKLRLCLC